MNKGKQIPNRVQLWNPVTKKWIKIDTTTGRIMAYKKSPESYKNIKKVEATTRHKPTSHVTRVQPEITKPI